VLATTLLGLIVTVGGAFSRWADVPGAISAALTCKAPTQTHTKGDSGNESGTQGLGEQHLSADGTPYLLVQGTPLAPDVAPIHPFLEPHEEGEDGDPGSLAGLTGQVVRSYEAWEGMDFSAEVAVESRAPGSEPHHTSCLLEGRVLADGRFDVRATTPVEVEGEPGVLQERWVFDGRQLLADVADQEVANAYSTTFFRFDRAFDTTCWGLLGVYDWLTDPLEFPLYETVAFEEVETEPGRVLARRTLGDPAPFVSSDYLYDTTGKVAHPLRRRLFDPFGRMLAETGYADFSRQGTSWRPQSTRRTRTWPDTPGEVEVTTLRIVRAERLAASAELPDAEFPANRVWQVWE